MNTQLFDEALSLCRALIAAPSDSGHEDGVVNALSEYFRSNGVEDIVVDRFGNFIATIHGNKPGKTVLFDGHMDTVPVTDAEQWAHGPYAGEIEDGKLYGRGTSDMKCALGCMAVAAVEYFRATKGNFAGNIAVAGVVHEECFEGVAAREISARVHPDLVVIGEASECNLKIGQRGRGEIVVETFGKSAHSANPDQGINAVYYMCKLIELIKEIEPPMSDVLGPGILELTDIKSSPYPGASVVPSHCRATYDRRLLVGETKESVLAPIQAVIDKAMAEIPGMNAKVSLATDTQKCFTGNWIEGERFFPGWAFDENSDFVQQVLAGLRDSGIDPVITHYNFCTNGSHYAGEAGIPTVGFGPSTEKLAHTRNEYIELAQMQTVLAGYLGMLGRVCPKD